LRPSDREQEVWWYCWWSRVSVGKRGNTVVEHELFEPTKLSAEELKDQNLLSGLAVNLCPLLQLVDNKENTAVGRIKRKGWQNNETVTLVGAPAESSMYANMFLTDPPTLQVDAELAYKHTLLPSLLIRAKRTVRADTIRGLTFNDMVRDVRTQRGGLFVHEPQMASNAYQACHYFMSESSITEEMVQRVREHGGTFALDIKKSFVNFPRRILVPSVEEWLEMDAKRVREKEKSTEAQSTSNAS
jgi:hypothetical protein